MKKFLFTLSLIISLTAAGCSSFGTLFSSRTGQLRASIAQLFDDSDFVNAHWGVMIKSLNTGETIYSRDGKKMFMPASNMKLFTTSSALAFLGPEYRYETKLVTMDSISNGALHGDIIFIGSGDPTITTRFNDSIPTKVFEMWADSVKAKGITEIDGDIIGDDNCFDEEMYGEGWAADYETDWYAAQVNGIAYNDNCVDMTVTADSLPGTPCLISWKPETKYISIINQTTTVPADSSAQIFFHRKRGTNIITITGARGVGAKPWIESIAVDNPTLYALTVLKEVFESKGIKIQGSVVDIDDLDSVKDYSSSRQLASYSSPPLSEIVKAVNKPSQNLYAEQILRTIGFQAFGKGSVESGKLAAYPILSRWGVDTVNLRMVDGSGLSRLDLVTPSDIVSILTGMYLDSAFPSFYESLPIAGVDGSLKKRMKGTDAEGNVHAKTGFIGYARTLSGYVTSADGEMFVFSMMANNYTVPTRLAEKIQDSVCVKLAAFHR